MWKVFVVIISTIASIIFYLQIYNDRLQNYPLSVNTEFCSPYLFNTKYSANLFSDNVERLFVSNDEMHIKVVEVGVEGTFFGAKHDMTTTKNYRLHFYRIQISR